MKKTRYQVYDGPLNDKFIDYLGERFRCDDKGIPEPQTGKHKYSLVWSDVSGRMFYTLDGGAIEAADIDPKYEKAAK